VVTVDSFSKDEAPSRIFQRASPYLCGPWFILLIIVMMITTYALDLVTPLGVPVWLFYLIPLLLSFLSKPRYAIPTVCFVTLLFLAAGFAFSPPGVQTSAAFVMRIVFAAIFMGISAVLWMVKRRQDRIGMLMV
jgi:hypothetical protein